MCFCCNRSLICLKKISLKSNEILSWVKRLLLNVCKKIDEYEKPKRETPLKNELFFISIKNDGIYLNDIKIIDRKAELQFAIFKILLKQHVISLVEFGRSSLNTYQIALELEKQHITITDLEKQIRQAIYKIKISILKNCNKHTSQKIIQSRIGSGYYIGNNVVIIPPKNM